MKNYILRLRKHFSHFAVALAIAGFVGSQMPAQSKPTPFSRIVVFGDSLSDTGNFYHFTGGHVPPPPYLDGRFSNGPLWVEYLAQSLGMQVLPEDDYAVAGATTGRANSNNGLLGLQYPGLQDQIEEFVAAHEAGADSDALYVLWAGANDFFVALESAESPALLIGGGVTNTLAAIQTLWQTGARQILVVNVPDLGLTPFGETSGLSDTITQLSFAYDQALESGLDALAAAGVPTIRVDAFTTLETMVNFPASFDFTNVTEPFLNVGGDPAGFLFWDSVHPTTRGHQGFAEAALHELIDYYSPRHGKGEPPALVNALNGLVHAGKGTP